MTRKQDSTLQIVRPDKAAEEQHERENFIHVTLTVGTPWDPPGQHMKYRTKISRAVFEMAQYGVLGTSLTIAAKEIENAIRSGLIPDAIQS